MGARAFTSRFAWQWSIYRATFERGCRAVGCRSTSSEDCPEHGIGAYYRRHAAAGTDSGD